MNILYFYVFLKYFGRYDFFNFTLYVFSVLLLFLCVPKHMCGMIDRTRMALRGYQIPYPHAW